MKYWIVLLGLCLMGCKHLHIGENFRGDIISEIDTCLVGGKHQHIEENSLKEFKDLNRPRIYIKYINFLLESGKNGDTLHLHSLFNQC